jgi:hypothetical protein
MTEKEMQKYIVYPKVKNLKKGNFFELIKKNMIKRTKGNKKSTLSFDIDKIVYGCERLRILL